MQQGADAAPLACLSVKYRYLLGLFFHLVEQLADLSEFGP
jgi:hypothetical protein